MPTFLVESYLPKAGSSPVAVVAALAGSGPGARHRLSLLLPEEDICFHVLDGASVEVVREATLRAALGCQRISEVLLIPAEDLDRQRGSP